MDLGIVDAIFMILIAAFAVWLGSLVIGMIAFLMPLLIGFGLLYGAIWFLGHSGNQ